MRPTTRADDEFTSFAGAAAGYLGRTAWLLTGDADRAQDAVQETLVRVYAAWSRARRGDPVAYARRVLVNHVTDTWRRARNRERPAGDALPEDVRAPDDLGAVLDRDRIVRMLAGLSARERSVVVLRYYHDLSERQVAHELGVSAGTVKSTASRALARLRLVPDEITDESTDEPPGSGGGEPVPPGLDEPDRIRGTSR